MQYSIPGSQPITLTKTGEMQVFMLFAFAMGLTAVGVFAGNIYAPILFRGGTALLLVIAEFAILLTAPLWKDRSPLNLILFALFPLLSGITISPYLWAVSQGYANGNAILFNALVATTFMSAAAALFARTTSINLGVFGRSLFFALLGIVGLTLLQIFVPALRQSIGFEMGLSAAGVVLFALFTAYDFQRVQVMSRQGANPFLLALNLYLDIFNLFLYVVRFMTAISGNRR
ncbi:MAG TPA: Bax inhibitor-1 family protein [Candidatus Peribacterales bacterium]|nr:Bax inhibitor-1 family protein [Candidatus Peribacterales bacterium]